MLIDFIIILVDVLVEIFRWAFYALLATIAFISSVSLWHFRIKLEIYNKKIRAIQACYNSCLFIRGFFSENYDLINQKDPLKRHQYGYIIYDIDKFSKILDKDGDLLPKKLFYQVESIFFDLKRYNLYIEEMLSKHGSDTGIISYNDPYNQNLRKSIRILHNKILISANGLCSWVEQVKKFKFYHDIEGLRIRRPKRKFLKKIFLMFKSIYWFFSDDQTDYDLLDKNVNFSDYKEDSPIKIIDKVRRFKT